ncbi:hypothetical protein TNCV_2165231 [Trichonephila clavipes]|nr:hypothetical protein TNCV_2165231 [Trichonephila clavipes]
MESILLKPNESFTRRADMYLKLTCELPTSIRIEELEDCRGSSILKPNLDYSNSQSFWHDGLISKLMRLDFSSKFESKFFTPTRNSHEFRVRVENSTSTPSNLQKKRQSNTNSIQRSRRKVNDGNYHEGSACFDR